MRRWAIFLMLAGGCDAARDAPPPAPVIASTSPTPEESARADPIAPEPILASTVDPETEEGPTPLVGPQPPTIRVALFQGRGVAGIALEETTKLLSESEGFELTILRGSQIRRGALDRQDVVIFTGGSGSAQGKSLGEEGRERVRRFVRKGGGYIGICAGSYLTMQGEEEFNKLGILAGRNKTGDYWKRGIKAIRVEVPGSHWADVLRMHYANGPIFSREPVEGLRPYVELASFREEIWSEPNGTREGEMIDTPAIVASRFGRGRMLLFSPNPVLGGGDVGHTDMMLDAIRWVSVDDELARRLEFDHVFHGPG